MKIQYCSDLHLEFSENERWMRKNPLVPIGDILILAGDITPLSSLSRHNWFFDWVSHNFKMTYWIPGNHEYYHYDIQEKDISVFEKIRGNIVFLNNSSVEFDKTVIHFTTLWSSISFLYEKMIVDGVSDFHCIRYKGTLIEASEFNLFHEKAVNFLNGAFAKCRGKDHIVISHHVPTFTKYPQEFYGSALSSAFAVEMKSFVTEWIPKYWVFGHHHRNVDSFKLGNTTMLTNQLGYVHIGENLGFVRDQIINTGK